MSTALGNRIYTSKKQGRYTKGRVGHCGSWHEGSGVRENYAKVNLDKAIEICPGCAAALSAQSNQVA